MTNTKEYAGKRPLKNLNILIDCTPIQNRITGIGGRYAINLLKYFSIYYPNNNYTVIVNSEFNRLDSIPDNFRIYRVRIPPIGFKRQILFLIYSKYIKKNYDVYHCLNEKWPIALNTGVCTFHDFRFFYSYDMFNSFSFLKTLYYRILLKIAALRCDRIIAISESCKNDTLRFLGEKYKNKIKRIYYGYTKLKNYRDTENDWDNLKDTFKIHGPFILSVSTIKKHKNIHGLIRGFNEFNRNRKNKYQLIIVGKIKSDNYYNSLQNICNDDIIFTDYVNDDKLKLLYEYSSAYIFYSFVEGFGHPLLEAMDSEIPTICSNVSSLPEISGEAAIKVSPYNYKELAEKIELVLSNKELRKKLVANGKRRLENFKWEKTAHETMKIYRKINSN